MNNVNWNEAMKIAKIKATFQAMPLKIGNLAERHFKESFRLKGFLDEGLETWPARKHPGGRGSLMIVSGALKRSIRRSSVTANSVTIVAGDGKVTYARIHNEGGTVNPTVTEKMRKYAWARVKSVANPSDAGMWLAIATTNKTRLTVKIPQRRFMGQSATLDRNTLAMITNEINTAFQ